MRTYLGFALIALACGSDQAQPDGGNDATLSDAGDAATLVCGNAPWYTYGGDAHRTSASDGCVTENLKVAWRYIPSPYPVGDAGTRDPMAIDHPLAEADGVYLTWGAQNSVGTSIAGTTQGVDRIDPVSGKTMWSFVPGFGDASTGEWATIGLGSVIYASDGLYWVDAATGKQSHPFSVDYWGDVLTDNAHAFVSNMQFIDGPAMFLRGYDAAGAQAWEKNTYGAAKYTEYNDVGAMAIDNGTLFFAAHYRFVASPPPLVSGLYAFDPSTGTQKWLQPSNPTSDIAAIDGVVYGSEDSSLVARKEADGAVIWKVPFFAPAPIIRLAAPVVTKELVITHQSTGVIACKRSDGSIVWSTPLAALKDEGISAIHNEPVLAASMGSNTLVAVDTRIHILSLSDGHEIVAITPPNLTGKRLTSPIVMGKRLYVIDRGVLKSTTPGALVALDSQ